MSKYIVCVFDDEKTAYQGVRAIRELDNEGSIAVYEGAIIAKDANGKIQIKDTEEQGPLGTLAGLLVGSLVGVLSGPAGVAVGAAVGSLSGLLVDIESCSNPSPSEGTTVGGKLSKIFPSGRKNEVCF